MSLQNARMPKLGDKIDDQAQEAAEKAEKLRKKKEKEDEEKALEIKKSAKKK